MSKSPKIHECCSMSGNLIKNGKLIYDSKLKCFLLKINDSEDDEIHYCPKCNTRLRLEYKTIVMRFKIAQVEHGMDQLTILHVMPKDRNLHKYVIGRNLEGTELDIEVKVPYDYEPKK